ncbi:MAG: NAD-dependent epimerase/dehydratase family protein [Bacteroidales bacterium]
MQTILGAGGAIGTELAKALTKYTNEIRLVSRHPKKINPGDELLEADLLQPGEVEKAVKGSEVVYVTVGFPYSLKFWREHWPSFMESVTSACAGEGAKMVFFDNIYMYDPGHLDGITEETPVRPSSEKGKIRAEIDGRIMQQVATGKLKALIARSADFYGPGIKNTSVLTEMVISPLSEGKTATWMGSMKFKHSYTYTPDAGKATALLGNTEDAYNQVWHVPTAPDPMTGKEWVNAFASELGVKPKSRTASKSMLRLLGIFVPVMKEMVEMLYQYDRDYVFNSNKFEKSFDLVPTSYQTGIKEIVRADYQKTGG